jgi:hypothetical protein
MRSISAEADTRYAVVDGRADRLSGVFALRHDGARRGLRASIVLVVVGVVVLIAGAVYKVSDGGAGSAGSSGLTPSTSTGVTVTSSGSPSPSAGMQATAVPPPSGSPSPSRVTSGPPVVYQPSGYPNPATTGVPAGTSLRTISLNSGDTYRVSTPGTVLDGVHISGDLLITAQNVTIKRSQIDGGVLDEYAGKHYSFTITDSTVGPASGCLTSPGIGEANYRATRVLIRGHGDGFRASGDGIDIQDSYVRLCSNPGDHSDGIQTYLTGKGLVLNHTTIDQRNVSSFNAPIFIVDDQTEDVTVTNNLVMGGTYTIQLKNFHGSAVVKYNRVVNKSWAYGPVEADCPRIDWSGNTLVTIDANYGISSVVGPLPCAT